MVDVEYDLATAKLHNSDDVLERFVDLLPVAEPSRLLSRPMKYTPCVHARSLGAFVGLLNLYLKNETTLPTRTTKDRMAVVSLAFLYEHGVRSFCASSTGNSSTAYAHALSDYPDCRIFLFTAEKFRERVDYGDHGRVVPFVLRDATFVDAFQCASIFARQRGIVAERGFFNPGRREGLKLAFFEATDQIPTPIDWYVQAVSSAMGVYGTYKGARELLAMGHISRLPRLLCVQQETCCPMVRAWKAGSDCIRPGDIVHHPQGIAKAILRGDPSRAYPPVRQFVLDSQGLFVAVSEPEIRDARRMVEEFEGISPCFSASAALAGLIQQVRGGSFPVHDTVMVNLTGGDRPATPNDSPKEHWLIKTPSGWVPEDPLDEAAQAFWN